MYYQIEAKKDMVQKQQLEVSQKDKKRYLERKYRIKDKTRVFQTSIQIQFELKTDKAVTDVAATKASIQINNIKFCFHQDHIIDLLRIKMEMDKVN